MTLEEMQKSCERFITPKDAAEVLGVDVQTLRVKATRGTLEFKFYRSGNRTKIFREDFLKYIGG